MTAMDHIAVGCAAAGCASDIQGMRPAEFSRLGNSVYVDYAGAALYSELQLHNVFQDLSANVVGNPHSQHSGPVAGGDAEATARQLTLDMCNASASDYECIFTSGATGAMKVVAEAFPWTEGSMFAHTADNHTSVLGIREIATHRGATATLLAPSPNSVFNDPARDMVERSTDTSHHLFAYPLESNFSGARYPLPLTTTMQTGRSGFLGDPSATREDLSGAAAGSGVAGVSRRWWVLLDAAKACGTSPPDLSMHKPDFVVLSYYKIFGYPSGLGALLVRKDALQILQRRYFGGGTVLACSAETAFVRRREGPAGFEDGTTSFLGIAALPHGFALIKRLGGFAAIEERTKTLTRSLAEDLINLRHFNGQPVCQLYGNHGSRAVAGQGQLWALGATGQGPTIALNLLLPDGSFVGYREVERLAGLSNIMLRGGCFCNPGACANHLGLTASDIQENFEAGKVCWDDQDLLNGRPTGAIRLSFGASSAPSDAAAILAFFRRHFVHDTPPQLPCPITLQAEGEESPQLRLARIWVYPIKSCRGCLQEEWWIGPNGLLFDREWALVGEDGKVLTLKKHPRLASIRPHLDLQSGVMRVSAAGMTTDLAIRLPSVPASKAGKQDAGVRRQIRLCAESVSSMQVVEKPTIQDDAALSPSEWFRQAVGLGCTLVQQRPGTRQGVTRSKLSRGSESKLGARSGGPPPPIGFANEAQILLTNTASLEDLNCRLAGKEGQSSLPPVDVERFRPNLVVEGGPPYCEDDWDSLAIGGCEFQVAGPCARCEVICQDPEKGSRTSAEPLLTLASYRRSRGHINFGVLLHLASQSNVGNEPHSQCLSRGMEVKLL